MKPKLVRGICVALLLSAGLLQGCATRQNPDPLEPFNRKIFAFNETLDDVLLRPAAKGYMAVTPQPVRSGISNFVGNLRDIWSAVNLFLQGRPGEGAQQLMRVSVNTTFGLAGLIDIATPMRLERQNEDFGQTLGAWGVKPGAYMVLPLFGPSTVRDSVGLPADVYFSASTVMSTTAGANTARAVQLVNARASLLEATNLLDDVALDKYSFVRDAFLQRRQNLVYNGEPPEDDEVDDYEPPVKQEPPTQGEAPAPQSLAPSAVDPVAQIMQVEPSGLPEGALAR